MDPTVATGAVTSYKRGVSRKALTILMPPVPDQHWSCHSCGRCCYDLVGHLTTAERERIDQQGWANRLDLPPYVKMGRSFVLNKRDNGACVFLDEERKLCRIHSDLGEEAKPVACRIYPFTLRKTSDGWRTALRFDCPSLAHDRGEPLGNWTSMVRTLAGRLDTEAAIAEESPPSSSECIVAEHLFDGASEDVDMLGRLAALAMLLADADLASMEDDRVRELIHLLGSGTAGVIGAAEGKQAGGLQTALMRELAFAHTEHVTIADMNAGGVSKLKRRWGQLRRASAFRSGRGKPPAIENWSSPPDFNAVSAVAPANDGAGEIRQMVRRYVMSRLGCQTVFGAGYYGWSIRDGLAALSLAMTCTGWLARYHAAGLNRRRLTTEDVFEALRLVDRSASRAPALGTRAERLRLNALRRDEGLVRLAMQFALVEQPRA